MNEKIQEFHRPAHGYQRRPTQLKRMCIVLRSRALTSRSRLRIARPRRFWVSPHGRHSRRARTAARWSWAISFCCRDEVSPAMSAALDNGLEVTALHNHFFYESPRVMYMHIGGAGEPEKLASAVKKVLDAQRGIRNGGAEPARAFPGGQVPTTNTIAAAPWTRFSASKAKRTTACIRRQSAALPNITGRLSISRWV